MPERKNKYFDENIKEAVDLIQSERVDSDNETISELVNETREDLSNKRKLFGQLIKKISDGFGNDFNSEDEALKWLEDQMNMSDLPESFLPDLKVGLLKWMDAARVTREYREKYPSDEDLVEKIVGFSPKERVEINVISGIFCLRFFDEQDYVDFYRGTLTIEENNTEGFCRKKGLDNKHPLIVTLVAKKYQELEIDNQEEAKDIEIYNSYILANKESDFLQFGGIIQIELEGIVWSIWTTHGYDSTIDGGDEKYIYSITMAEGKEWADPKERPNAWQLGMAFYKDSKKSDWELKRHQARVPMASLGMTDSEFGIKMIDGDMVFINKSGKPVKVKQFANKSIIKPLNESLVTDIDIHENQHAINTFYEPIDVASGTKKVIARYIESVLTFKESTRYFIVNLINDYLTSTYNDFRDELLAMFRGGDSSSSAVLGLSRSNGLYKPKFLDKLYEELGGIDDSSYEFKGQEHLVDQIMKDQLSFISVRKTFVARRAEDKGKSKNKINSIKKRKEPFFNKSEVSAIVSDFIDIKFKRKIFLWVEAIYSLEKYFDTREDVIAFLYPYPISQWMRIARNEKKVLKE